MCPRMICFRRARASAVALVLWVALPALADQVKAGADNFPRGRIVSFEAGVLKFRTPDNELHPIPITAVDQIVVDSVPDLKDFNAAEEFLAKDQPGQAAVRYERALRVAEGSWPDLIRVRLLQARDRAGDFDKSVTDFIHVAEILPSVAVSLIPRSVPDRASDATRSALERLDAAVRRNAGRPAEPVLQMFRYAIVQRVDSQEAERMAMTIASLPAATGDGPKTETVWWMRLAAVGSLLEQRRHADVVECADRLLASAPDTLAPDLLLLKGRAVYSAGASSDDFLRAGLVFMRVVVHFPDSARAGEALLWAARVHERIQRPAQAVALLRECMERQDVPQAVGDEARQMLKRLTGEGTEARRHEGTKGIVESGAIC